MKISLENSTSLYELNNQKDLDKIDRTLLNEIDPHIYYFFSNWFSATKEINVSTSGSTGKPKIISIPKNSMRQSAKLTLEYFDIQNRGLMVNCLPVKYIAGKMMIVRALVGKLHLHLIKPSDAPLCNFPDEKVTFSALTPSQIEKSMQICDGTFDNIQTIIIGGAPISSSLKEKLQRITPNCFASYGMTETITHIALQKINNGSENVFKTLETVEIGYHEQANLKISAPHLLDSPVLTNDMVSITSSNTFKWLGRSDFVINSGGVKIFPESIESKLSKLIKGAFFIHKIQDPIYSQIPVLVIEDIQHINWNEIQKAITKIEIPKYIFRNKSFTYTESGKINRLISFKNSKEIKK